MGGAVAACVDGAGGPSNTHGHMVSIPQTHIDDPQDRMYGSTGGTHDHTVSVTSAQLTELAANGTVTVSSNDTHLHTWIITCV